MKNTEVSLYEIYEENFDKLVCQLIEKCYQTGYNSFVRTKDEIQQESLNKMLWTFSQKSFIAHGSILDLYPEKQPVLLSSKDEVVNNAEILVSVGLDFSNIDIFSRVLFLFNGNFESEKILCEELYQKYKNKYQTNYYLQGPNGSWKKRAF